MASINIYNQESNTYYKVNFDLKQTVMEDTADGNINYGVTVTTTIPTTAGGTFSTFLVKTLADTPVGYGVAADFNELWGWWIDYFQIEAELAQSSSSSSSQSSSSSSSVGESSSSSSVGESSSSSSVGESSSSSSSSG